jgi:hypothetical protein
MHVLDGISIIPADLLPVQHSTNYTTMHVVNRISIIPADLLPIKQSKYTVEWGRTTFCHAYKFDKQFVSVAYRDDAEVTEWVKVAKNMYENIKRIGYEAGIQEVIKRASTEYGMKLPSNPMQAPVNLDDVMTVIGDPNWYKDNTDSKRRIIHMLAYGMFRQGQNGWAHEAARVWLNKYKLTISSTTDGRVSVTNTEGYSRRQIKGFVYSIIVSRVSNTLADRMISVCKRSHGEHIAVRKTKQIPTSGYTQLLLNGCDAYLVTIPQAHEINMTVKHQKCLQLQRCIREALAAGITEAAILEMVKEQHAQCIYTPRKYRGLHKLL